MKHLFLFYLLLIPTFTFAESPDDLNDPFGDNFEEPPLDAPDPIDPNQLLDNAGELIEHIEAITGDQQALKVLEALVEYGKGPQDVDSDTEDLPQLDSCCLAYDECAERLEEVEEYMRTVFETLENNHLKYRVVMEKYRLSKNLANSVGSFSPAGKAAFNFQELRNIGPAKKKYFANYDQVTEDLVNKFKTALNKVSALEKEYCGQANWMELHGYTLVLVLKSRYARNAG